jgi:hypothetical protein
LNQERALNLFVLSHFLQKTGFHQQNLGVPEFCHYQWRKSETSDLEGAKPERFFREILYPKKPLFLMHLCISASRIALDKVPGPLRAKDAALHCCA